MIDLSSVTLAELEADPYPIYTELRSRAPVAYMPCLDTWMVTTWATVEAACVDAASVLVVASANRDVEVWGPTADAFDIHRPKRAHLSFAVGPHYCIGHYFARAQLAVAVGMLLDRFPRLQLAPDHTPTYRGHEYRSPTSLRVLVD